MKYLNEKAIRKYLHKEGRQIGRLAIEELDRKVDEYLEKLCRQHNGHKKRITPELIRIVRL